MEGESEEIFEESGSETEQTQTTSRERKKDKQDEGEESKCTKEEYAIGKHLRFNVPLREGKLAGMTVTCFIASKAVDGLLDSKWAKGKRKEDILFTDRKSCVAYCDTLLQKGLFHRAEKVERKKDKSKKKRVKEEEQLSITEEAKEKKTKKDKKGKKEKDKEIDKETEKTEELEKKKEEEEKKDVVEKKDEKKDEKKEGDKKKKEKKLKLNMHDDQRFVDGEEVYVWIYDPVPAKTFVIGLLMVLGAIGLCMFPLWPDEVRIGVYYISLAGASFVGVILLLIVIRFIMFCSIWVLTFGKLHFWLLPNLTEDVGFFDSFKPLYTYERMTASKDTDKKSKIKSKKTDEKKSKDETESEHENEGEVQEGENEEVQEGEGEDQEGSQDGVIDDDDDDLEILDEDEDLEAENVETKKEK